MYFKPVYTLCVRVALHIAWKRTVETAINDANICDNVIYGIGLRQRKLGQYWQLQETNMLTELHARQATGATFHTYYDIDLISTAGMLIYSPSQAHVGSRPYTRQGNLLV